VWKGWVAVVAVAAAFVAVIATTSLIDHEGPAPAYEPGPHEVEVDLKRAAAATALALTTYDADDTLSEVVATVTDDPLRRGALREAAVALHHPGERSRGTVVYPEIAGLREASAAVIVVVRQEVGPAGRPVLRESRSLDVRLVRAGGRWRFDQLASTGGDPVERPAGLGAAAAAVLDDPRIEMPDSARWDIHRGVVDDRLLSVMAALARRTPFAVAVLSTGHSLDVYATGRPSAHSAGRAVDIYLLGDTPVVADRADGSPTQQVVRWLLEQGDVAQVGSPWDLGAGNRSFTDAVHQDHLHVAV
jgi:hypothetical protein